MNGFQSIYFPRKILFSRQQKCVAGNVRSSEGGQRGAGNADTCTVCGYYWHVVMIIVKSVQAAIMRAQYIYCRPTSPASPAMQLAPPHSEIHAGRAHTCTRIQEHTAAGVHTPFVFYELWTVTIFTRKEGNLYPAPAFVPSQKYKQRKVILTRGLINFEIIPHRGDNKTPNVRPAAHTTLGTFLSDSMAPKMDFLLHLLLLLWRKIYSPPQAGNIWPSEHSI